MMKEIENRMIVDSEWGWIERGYSDEDRLLDEIYVLDEDDEEMLSAEADMVDDDVLAELVENKTGIHPESAWWNARIGVVKYEYYDDEVA